MRLMLHASTSGLDLDCSSALPPRERTASGLSGRSIRSLLGPKFSYRACWCFRFCAWFLLFVLELLLFFFFSFRHYYSPHVMSLTFEATERIAMEVGSGSKRALSRTAYASSGLLVPHLAAVFQDFRMRKLHQFLFGTIETEHVSSCGVRIGVGVFRMRVLLLGLGLEAEKRTESEFIARWKMCERSRYLPVICFI